MKPLQLLIIACATSLAHGDIITETISFNLGFTDERTAMFDQFNGSLGTLIDVQLEVTAIASASVSLQNTSGSGRTANTRVFGWVEYVGPGFAATGPDAIGVNNREFEMLDSFFVNAGQVIMNRSIGNSTINTFGANPSNHAPYIGPGKVGVNFDYVVGAEITPPGVFSTAFGFNGFTIATMVYEFVPVPMPSSASALALMGMLVSRRRR